MSAKDKPVSMPTTDEYRNNYDKIFNKDKGIRSSFNHPWPTDLVRIKDGKSIEECNKEQDACPCRR